MAITRYAGDRFTIAAGETKPTGVLDGGYLIDTGNLTQFVKRTVGGTSQWSQLAGGGGGGTPGGSTTQVQFNDGGSFAGDADLTFTNGNQLNVNKLSIAANIIDSNSSIGEGGMVLTNEGTTGVHWKNIESVLSGVGGSGVANYVARWSDEDTLTSGTIYDNGNVGIGTANPRTILHVDKASADEGAVITIGNQNNTNGSYCGLEFINSTAGYPRSAIFAMRTGGYNAELTFHTSADNHITGSAYPDATERMRIDHDGNVGIGTNAPDYTLDVAGDIGVNQYIRHNGDPDTHINFTSDDINIQVGGVNMIDLSEGGTNEITFNEQAADLDIRMEGATDANLFFLDASTDKVV